jgi:hypothetical protein
MKRIAEIGALTPAVDVQLRDRAATYGRPGNGSRQFLECRHALGVGRLPPSLVTAEQHRIGCVYEQ